MTDDNFATSIYTRMRTHTRSRISRGATLRQLYSFTAGSYRYNSLRLSRGYSSAARDLRVTNIIDPREQRRRRQRRRRQRRRRR